MQLITKKGIIQLLSEMSKEESATIIVYPYGDRKGEDIAHSAGGVAGHKHLPQPVDLGK